MSSTVVRFVEEGRGLGESAKALATDGVVGGEEGSDSWDGSLVGVVVKKL